MPSSSPVSSGRLPWVEIARMLATLSVITQHLPTRGFPPNQWIIGPALATFFILAGYFSATRIQGDRAGAWTLSRLKSLAIPYFFWCVTYWLLSGMPCSPDTLTSVFGLGVCPMLTPMWFLRDLMIFTLIVFCLRRARMVLYALGVICLFLNRWDDTLAWPSPYMFGDFVLGIMLASIPGSLRKWENISVSVHAAVLLAYASLIWLNCTDTFLLPDGAFAGLGILAFLSAGIVIRALSPRAACLMERWSSGSFFVYCAHIFMLIVLMGVEKCFPFTWPDWLWWCMVPGVYLLTRGLYLLIKRYVPGLLVVMTGGK